MKTRALLRPLVFAVTILSFAFIAFGADQPGATPVPPAPRTRKAQLQNTPDGEPKLFDEMYQFIFFAALEGLYRDGVSSADVESLLARNGRDGGYLNFISTCPIWMPVEVQMPLKLKER